MRETRLISLEDRQFFVIFQYCQPLVEYLLVGDIESVDEYTLPEKKTEFKRTGLSSILAVKPEWLNGREPRGRFQISRWATRIARIRFDFPAALAP